jgi:glycosyltransferase involved in cell wall biosynthesis
MMRIAFIHPFLYRYPRGIERYTISLANALAQSGDEVHILTWRWPKPIQIDSLDASVHLHLMPTSRYYASQVVVPFYAAHLLAQQYDFVWIFFAGYGEAASLALAHHQPFGIVLHYPIEEVPHRYREFRRYGTVMRAQQIVSVSQFVADGAQTFFGRASTIISHGVDTRRFAPDSAVRHSVRQALNMPSETPMILSTAALEERKGIQWVLRALPYVLQECPDVQYVVLGEGPYRATLDQMARDLGVAHAVHLIGTRSDSAPYYQAADVTALLSRGEASPLTLLETLACGTPIITSMRRPFDELIEPEFGIRVPEQDERHVAEAIVTLLRDPARRRAMGEHGRARILKDFQWDQVASQYIQLLDPDRRTLALAPGHRGSRL